MFEQNEIKFFKEEIMEEMYMMDKPPHSNNPACSTPNPPWWCNENDSNAVSIDMNLLVLVIIAVLIKIIFEKI